MAKIKVKALNTSDPYKTSTGGDVGFSLASSPKDGRRQVLGFMSCKAFVHDVVTEFIVKGQRSVCGTYRKENNPPVDMNKLRLLVATSEKDIDVFKKKLFAAKKMLNIFEEAAGWKKSKITTVDHETLGEKVWLITGPKQWMASPHMISFVTLIIRIATRKGPVKVKTKEDVLNQLKEWAEGSRYSSDVNYVQNCWQKLFPLVENFDEIFKGLTPEQCYGPGRVGMHSNGIAYLGQYKCGCEQLNKRLKEVCEEKKGK
jgi:hypothetical protein